VQNSGLEFRNAWESQPVLRQPVGDELSKQIADSQKDIQVFDRGLLKTYIAVANLPVDSPKNDEEAREFARGLGANAIVLARPNKLKTLPCAYLFD
jgi:hypothetical protein